MNQSINERAMLTSLKITRWSATKYDRQISNEIAAQKGASQDAGNYNKRLIDRDSLIREIKKIAGNARNEHYELTLPWSDEGFRILPNTLFTPYSEKMRALKGEYEKQVKAFLAEYPNLIRKAQRDLGSMFDARDYPSVEKVAESFTFQTVINPLPVKSDFRVDLEQSQLVAIQKEIENSTKNAVRVATDSVFERVSKTIGHLADRLGAYDEENKGKNPFRDSMMENLESLAGLLPSLNIGDDPKLDQISGEIQERLTVYTPKDLRENKFARDTLKKNAEEILDSMAGYFGDAPKEKN